MIVTVTLNPSLDRTLALPVLTRGAVLRATAAVVDPGGKGVNVSRSLAAHGADTRAVLPVGGADGQALAALLAAAGVDADLVPVAGATRSNVTVVEPDGTTTKLNAPGPALAADELAAVLAAALAQLRPGDWLVLAGSLPPGVPAGVVATLGAAVRDAGASYAVDSSGDPLRAALGARAALVKPNREELAELVGVPLATVGEVAAACHGLLERGVGSVLCSLGADGALLVDGDGVLLGRGPVVPVVNTVGAGDNLLAGFLFAGGRGAAALRTGIAWATAAVATSGTGVPAAADLRPDDVTLTDRLDPDRPLQEAS